MRKKTNAEFVRQVQDLVGDSYVFLQDYKNTRTKLAYYHVDCGEVHYIKPGEFKGTKSHKGRRCPTCATLTRNLKNTKTDAQWLKEVQDLTGDEYTFLEPYQGNHTPIYYYHKDCGKVRKIDPANFLSGHRCGYCSPTRNKTDEEFRQSVKELVGNEYTVLTTYYTNRAYVKMRHNKCGKEWDVLPVNFLNGSRCPKCNMSHGELLIYNLLQTDYSMILDKDFIHAYVLPNKLHLDFYLPKIKVGIEYDGIQHYVAKEFFGGEAGLISLQMRDKRKDHYCKEHSITLVRISYTVNTKEGIKKILSPYINQ